MSQVLCPYAAYNGDFKIIDMTKSIAIYSK